VARKKRTQRRRVQAGDIRDKAVEQSHEVGQREALADETAAEARAAQAEAEALAAHSAGLQHQAQARHTEAATSRSEVNREFERADKIDPDAIDPDAPTSDTSRGDAAGPTRPNMDAQGRITFSQVIGVTHRVPELVELRDTSLHAHGYPLISTIGAPSRGQALQAAPKHTPPQRNSTPCAYALDISDQ
jgi:hypothetical protein